MKKIDLTPYKVTATVKGEEREIDYDMKASIINCLFAPVQQLKAHDLLKQEVIAKKIFDAGDAVILEESDYNIIKSSVELIAGLSRNDVEFVTRIIDAETPKMAEQL